MNALATLETKAKLRNIIRSKAEPDPGVMVHLATDKGGHGLVLWSRPEALRTGREYIVHRWATVYTDGSPVPGGMLYSGFYTMSREAALRDFEERP